MTFVFIGIINIKMHKQRTRMEETYSCRVNTVASHTGLLLARDCMSRHNGEICSFCTDIFISIKLYYYIINRILFVYSTL